MGPCTMQRIPEFAEGKTSRQVLASGPIPRIVLASCAAGAVARRAKSKIDVASPAIVPGFDS
jgi:hypothetical protein